MNKNTTRPLLLLFTFLLLSTQVRAQAGYAWEKFGNGINNGAGCIGNILASKYIDSNLYVCEVESNGKNATIHKWNGTAWSSYPKIEGGNFNVYIRDIEVYRNEVYVSGYIRQLKNLSRPGNKSLGVIKFNGNTWDSLPSYPTFTTVDSMDQAFRLCTYKHKLYYSVQSIRDKLFSLDSFGTTTLIATNSIMYSGAFNNLKVFKNKLMVSGNIDSVLLQRKTAGVFYFDGSSLSFTASRTGKNIWSTFIRNDSQYVTVNANNTVELWEQDNLIRTISPPYGIPYYNYNGFTFFGDYILATFGDTMGIIDYSMSSNTWGYKSLGGSGKIVALEAGPNKGIIAGCKFFKGGGTLKQGGIVNGRLYFDRDSNCVFNSGDQAMPYRLVELSNGTNSIYTYTDVNGNYSISALPGNYSLKTPKFEFLYTFQPCTTAQVSIVAGNTYNGRDLTVHPSRYRNLSSTITAVRGFRTRRGFTEDYILSGTNFSWSTDSLILKLKYPTKATFVSSDISPFSNSNNELIFKFYNLNFLDKKAVKLKFSTSVNSSNLGDSLWFSSQVVNSVGDSLIENNYDTLFQRIVGSYDPNIKESYPEGQVKPGLKKIKYMIHFQNTGTDTAYKVSVVDTITQKLGLRSIRVTGTSHPSAYSLRVMNKQTLVWEFNNILLPDSHVNEKASHGYIAFEANIDAQMAVGDSINNKAYIYFDYNEPIITNMASVVLVDSLMQGPSIFSDQSNPIQVYPNPAQSYIQVVLKDYKAGDILKLHNALGQLVQTVQVEEPASRIDISHLSRGIYILTLEGSTSAVKIIIE